MTDHYSVLQVRPNAGSDEIQEAFESVLADRRSRRRKTGDVYAALAVLSDPVLRRAYDAQRLGVAASERIVHAKAVTIDFARDAIPEVDLRELASQAREVGLKSVVVGSGATARIAEVTATVARAVQSAAGRALTRHLSDVV